MRASQAAALLLVVLCAHSCASERSASTQGITTKVVAKGRAPVGEFGYRYMRAVTLMGSKSQLLAIPRPRAIYFFRVHDTTLMQQDSLLLSDTVNFEISPGSGSAMRKRKAFWTTGDVNCDGDDEVIVAMDTLVLIYNRRGTGFVPDTVALPKAIRQMVVGDIDNDGRNELIACCDTTTNGRWRKRYMGMKYCVYVCRYAGKRLEVLWNDHAKLGYGDPIMPDYFWSVADFQNLGRNQLLVSRSQSDVSPTLYDLLEWNRDARSLSRQTSFLVSDDLVPAAKRDSSFVPFALGGMLPLRTGMGTVLAVEVKVVHTSSSGDIDAVFRQRLLRITGRAIQPLGDVRNLNHPSWGDYDATLDPDGSGTGIIRIWGTGPRDYFFEFRRVVVGRRQPRKDN